MKNYLILLIVMTGATLNSFGQDKAYSYPLDKKYEKCLTANPSTYGSMECAQNVGKEWDKELNKYYKLLMEKLDKDQQNDLGETQRQWMAFRDKQLRFNNQLFGKRDGTIWNVVLADAAMQITRQRAIELMETFETITQN